MVFSVNLIAIRKVAKGREDERDVNLRPTSFQRPDGNKAHALVEMDVLDAFLSYAGLTR